MYRGIMKLGLCLLASCLAVSSAGCVLGPLRRVERTDTFTAAASQLDRLELKTYNGSITVHARPGDVEIVVTRFGPNDQAVDRVNVDHCETGGTFNLTCTPPSWVPNTGARITVYAPPGLALSARTSNGPVSVAGWEAALHLTTSNGPVDVSAGPVGIPQIYVKTSNGTIEAELGMVGGGNNTLDTSNGHITVHLDPASSLSLTAATSNGSIELSSGEWVVTNLGKNSFSGRLGPGGATLQLRTSNGSIRIKP